MKASFKKILTLLIAASVTGMTYAYEVPTHTLFCELAVSRSVLSTDGSLWTDLDMPFGLETTYPASTGGVRLGSSLVPYGSIQEDEEFQTRVFNHFFDPQYNNFAGRGMNAFGFQGNPSPNWAIEDIGEVRDIKTNAEQLFSIRQLQQYYYQVFAASAMADRQTYMGRVLESLGHAIHHIQDMGQPQHVRNDQHVHPLPLPGPPINPDWSFYERFSQDRLQAPVILSLVNAANYPTPTFQTTRQFWHTLGATTGRYVGMAEFTSNNYVSWGKNFQPQSTLNSPIPVRSGSDMPLPDSANVDGSQKSVQTRTVTITMPDFSQRTGAMDFAIGKVYDGSTGIIVADQKLAAVSVVSGVGVSAPFEVFTENSGVYEDEYKILVPRIVAFSTGLINHMFRGRLDVSRYGNTTSWTVANRSGTVVAGAFQGQAINGVMSLYYEDASQVRRPLPGAAPQTVNLGYGQTINIGTVEAPAGTKKIIAAFAGRIGGEGDPSGSGFYAVAGKVIAYTPPTIPCGAPFSAQGDYQGTTQLMDLGSAGGTVQGEVDTYAIPDSMVVRRGSASGTVLYTTGGQVSGYHVFSFNHPGGSDPAANKIWINVVGNTDQQTLWTSTIGCPGQQIGNADRVLKRVNITFSVNGQGGGGCATGSWDIYLDNSDTRLTNLRYGDAGGASTLPITVTEGANHRLRLVRFITDSGQFGVGCNITRPSINTSAGSRDISGYVGNGGSIAIP